jgi:hypothetical protein
MADVELTDPEDKQALLVSSLRVLLFPASPADVGLALVNNTSDIDKPISTLVTQALAGKLSSSQNLGDLSDLGNARTNLGLGSAATMDSAAFASASHVHADATLTTDGFMSATDFGKLSQIAALATKNDTDANLRDRSTHTGTQGISTVDGLTLSISNMSSAILNNVGIQIQDTADNIALANAPINITNKYIGKIVWDTTNNRAMRARSADSTGIWDLISGGTSVTPV